MLPHGLTQNVLDNWISQAQIQFELTPDEELPIPRNSITRAFLQNTFCPAIWLHRQLSQAGCADETIAQLSSALGQKIAMGDEDPWVLVDETVRDYKMGIIDLPGDSLAQKLIASAELRSQYENGR